MLETLYVMTPGISIRQDGGLLVLEKDHSIIKEVPMATVSNLVLGRTIQISTQVMFSLVKQGSLIQFVDHKYQLVGTLGTYNIATLVVASRTFSKSRICLSRC